MHRVNSARERRMRAVGVKRSDQTPLTRAYGAASPGSGRGETP